MADPLSMLASVAGVVALAASTARTLISLIQEMKDAPEEILHIRRDVQNLSAVLGSIHELSARHDLMSEDYALVDSLKEYLELCQDSMQSIRAIIAPLAGKGSGRRSPIRMVGWVMKKGEIRTLRERLQEGKASLNITISALNGVLEGKGQDEIKNDVNKVYERLVIEFRNRDSGRRVRRRMEDDVASVSAFSVRRQKSELTDAAFPMKRYFDQLPEPPKAESSRSSHSHSLSNSETILLNPFSSNPTTLLEAVRARDKEGVVRLIANGSSTAERSEDGQTVLHYCAIYNDQEIAELLLDHGADINARDHQLRSPLNVALSSEAMNVANLLIERGCSLTGSIEMVFPLTQRIEEVPGVRILLKTLAPKFNKSTSGPYLVHQAVELNDTQSLELLLSVGLNPNVRNKYGLPPLYQAMMLLHKEAVRILLEHGADPNDYLPPETRDKFDKNVTSHSRMADKMHDGILPLAVAARVLRDVEITRMLLDNGADPNYIYPSNGGVTLSGLGSEEYLECAKAIIDKGADAHMGGFDKMDPFYWANGCRNPRLMDYMLTHGAANVNHFYWDDNPSALFLSSRWGYPNNVEVLLKHGADMTVKNNSGLTPLDIAKAEKRQRVVDMLTKAMSESKSE